MAGEALQLANFHGGCVECQDRVEWAGEEDRSMVRKVKGEEVTPGARKRRDYILFIAFLFQK